MAFYSFSGEEIKKLHAFYLFGSVFIYITCMYIVPPIALNKPTLIHQENRIQITGESISSIRQNSLLLSFQNRMYFLWFIINSPKISEAHQPPTNHWSRSFIPKEMGKAVGDNTSDTLSMIKLFFSFLLLHDQAV